MKKFLSIASNTILVLILVGAVVFLVVPRFGYKLPLEIKIVRSGSMEPAIHTGSIVAVYPSPSYAVGDVITFGADTRTAVPTTHRIVSIRTEGTKTFYSTKGDANEDVDSIETPASRVIGGVVFTLPFAGYILAFAREPLGFLMLIVIPTVLIIVNELIALYTEMMVLRKRRLVEQELGEIANNNSV